MDHVLARHPISHLNADFHLRVSLFFHDSQHTYISANMPEIAESMSQCLKSLISLLTKWPVARVVHHLRKSIVGKTLSVVKAQDDANVFGKVGTSGAEFQKALTGKEVISAGQQGKYFW